MQQGAGSPSEGERAAVESKSVSDMEITEEAREVSDDAAAPTREEVHRESDGSGPLRAA
ncbi:hypothetical protein PENSPDRAFT_655281 [Peniophora sp. CONT]|nr:hypothetical protein PENSPDRAFT_655281 [Peniophora sp. CONT]